MKRKKLAYEYLGKGNAGFATYIIPKHKRPRGVDGIQLCWRNSREAKKNNIWHSLCIKDWEALVIIEALTVALIEKGYLYRKKRRKSWKNK